MNPVTSLIAVIGQGHAPGVKVRVAQVDALGQVNDARVGDREVPHEQAAMLEQRWALAGDAYATGASPRGLTLKIARRIDQTGQEWLWVGLYRPAEFSQDSRRGLYFGAGILFGGAPEPRRAVEAISILFQQAATALFTGERMTGSVEALDVWALRVPAIGALQPLRQEGLDGRSRTGRLVASFDIRSHAKSALETCLSGADYQDYSTVYFCEDGLDARSREFPTNVEAVAPAPPPPPRSFPSEESYLSSGGFGTQVAGSLTDFEDQVLRRLRGIEQRASGIERQLGTLKDERFDGPNEVGTGSGVAHKILVAILALLVLVLLYFGFSWAWDRWSRRSQPDPFTAQRSADSAAEAEEAGPKLVVKPLDQLVQAGQPVRVTATALLRGADSAAASIVIRENGQALASDYRNGLKAEADVTIEKAGNHRLTAECEARHAVVESCAVEALPAGGGEKAPPNPQG